MNPKKTKILLAVVSLLLICTLTAQVLYMTGEKKEQPSTPVPAAQGDRTTGYSLSREGYKLDKVVILSRHNIRSPLSGNGSMLGTITPHEWFSWSSPASELSLRGGALETLMGQFFRKWLEKEGLFPENYKPENGEVRIYANSKQRTIATAGYFTAGLLPTANVPVEYHAEYDTMDPVFTPQLTFVSDRYCADVEEQIRERFADDIAELEDNYALLADVINMKESEAWKNGDVSALVTDDLALKLELNAEPGMSGSLKTACSVSDALVLQYYEESDDALAAFGHSLSDEDWRAISEIKDVYGDVLFTAPLVAPNVAHPLLQEIENEMKTENRAFTFLCGHDSNVGSVLAALGVTEYTLPEAIESKTPIGCKLVFAKWTSEDGKDFWSVDLVYQSVAQLRNLTLLDLSYAPVVYPIEIPDLPGNEDGLYPAEALSDRIADAIAEYDAITERYTLDAAA